MLKKISLALALTVALHLSASAQSLTTITGTMRDNSGALITSGQIAFTLQPGVDTQTSGVARFSPTEIDCLINGSGLVKALDGVSACTLVQNTSITSPTNTSYRACVQPSFIQPGSCFVFYALTSTLDITTTPATPALTPAYSLVDVFSNQTISGTKTFTGTVILSIAPSFGGLTLTGDYINTALGTIKWGSSGTTSPDTGLSRNGVGVLAVGNGTQGNTSGDVQAGRFDLAAGGSGTWNFRPGFLDSISTGGLGWSSGANATTGIDTGITRGGAAATVAVGNGTQGDITGTIFAKNITLSNAALGSGAALTVGGTSSTTGGMSIFVGAPGSQSEMAAIRPADGATAALRLQSLSIRALSSGFLTGTENASISNAGIIKGTGFQNVTPSKQIFTANGTFTIPAGVTAVKVTVVGAGGAGGGGNAAGSGNGGGGAAGGAGIKWLTGLTPANTLTVTVGTGGTGASGTTGNSGTSSSVSSGTQTISTITANGGVGGSASAGVANASGAIETAAGTGGDLNLGGAGGSFAFSSGPYGGPGGNSIFGGAGGNTASAGRAATGLGSGGGGAASNATQAGGAGGGGVVIFEWVQ